MDWTVLFILLTIVITYGYRKKCIEPEIYSLGYFEGWRDRHQGEPLLPRYWKHIRFLDYHDPYEQMVLTGLPKSVTERFSAGLPPYARDYEMEYALSDREIELLANPQELKWRGLSEYDAESPIFFRHPRGLEKADVQFLLEMGYEEDEIREYFRVDELELIRGRFKKVKKVRYSRNPI